MFTLPEITEKEIIKYLQDVYGLNVYRVSFLPIGADYNIVGSKVKKLQKY